MKLTPDDPLVTDALEVMELAAMVHVVRAAAGGYVVITRMPIPPDQSQRFITDAAANAHRRRLMMADVLETIAHDLEPEDLEKVREKARERTPLPNHKERYEKGPGDSDPEAHGTEKT